MMVRQIVARFFCIHDVSLSSILLLMIIASLGCDSRKGDSHENGDSDAVPSAKNSKAAAKDSSAGPQTASPPQAAATSEKTLASSQDKPLRIVSSDGKSALMVHTSLTATDNSQYHLRELMVNPYFNELLACARTYAAIGDTQRYQTHFRVQHGRRIVFHKLSAVVRVITSSPASTATKTAQCLRGLYGNVVVELSGTVPMSEFYLTFDF
ncbi:MAG: hypothetical protein JXX14_22125 [Deltaproteobacteria bacterium]|nr:hypothetical protein [Deltaproteobacteria bacterium]